ncbi:MAG: DUF4625 domain-containing protein [Tannerellaceae bacterium]|jgi:hypothetical protein|nr:DUF4625 domain-containing protein [Tannerellaceae bacterium]
MKVQIISLALATLAFGFFNACEQGDTQKPIIDLVEPEEGDLLAIGHEHGVHLEMKLSDNDALNSYRVQIHNAFDGHPHQETRSDDPEPFFYDSVFTDIQGKRNTHIHHHAIVIPEGVAEGNYHLEVRCLDVSGNEAYAFRNVRLGHEEDDDHHDEDEHED